MASQKMNRSEAEQWCLLFRLLSLVIPWQRRREHLNSVIPCVVTVVRKSHVSAIILTFTHDFDNHSKCCLCCHGTAKIKGGSCPNVVTPFSADPLGRAQSVELPPPHFSLLSAAVEPDQIPFLHIMVNHQRKYSKSHTRLPKSQRSIHQSGPNATFTVQGTYNDVGRDQNIINVTYSGGTLRIIQPEQILT